MGAEFSRVSQCEGKRHYPSKVLAKQAERRARAAGLDPMCVYRCGWCDAWHVGHKPALDVLTQARERRAV